VAATFQRTAVAGYAAIPAPDTGGTVLSRNAIRLPTQA